MANFSKFSALVNGSQRTADLSLTSSVLELGGEIQFDGSTSGHVVISASATTTTYAMIWPSTQAASAGYVLSNDGTGQLSWVSASSGSVTSVALALPSSVFTVSGSPVTSTGTLTGTFATQSANTFFAGATSGGVATPAFRGLVSADIPNNAANTSGTAANVTATSNATLVTLSALTTASALVSVGTIGSGTWQGTVIGTTFGGTGGATAAAGFANLSPMTTAGDLIFENATPAPARLGIGSTGQVLTVSGGLPVWAAPATGGTVTSVAFSDASTAPIYSISGSPVTTSGTLSQTLVTQAAHAVFAGPTSGAAAQPAFRALVAGDVPDLSATYVTQSEVGAPSGVASLDSGGHVPLSQLPSSIVEYKGTWDASTNTPTLANGTGTSGWFYIVSVAGSVDFGAGSIAFNAGDWVLYNGSIWERAVQSNIVQSVNSATGIVTVNAINQLTGDVTASAATASQSKASTVAAIQGKTVSGTTGTGNVVFSASPTVTGVLTAATVTASGPVTGSNLSGTNTGDQTITLTGDVTGSGTGSFATAIGAAKVSATQLATGAFDQVTIVGGAGTAASVVSAPSNKELIAAGETFAATTLFAVRFAKAADSGFVAGRVYKADSDTTSADNFYVIGLVYQASSTAAGALVGVTKTGSINVPSHGFTVGAPLFLSAAGIVTATPPSASLSAVQRVGIVRDTNNIEVQIAQIGVN